MAHMYAVDKTPISEKKIHTGWKLRMENIFHANANKKARVAIFISDKIDFKTKAITGDKEGH